MMDRVAAGTAAVAQPVIWSALGYRFEAASMIAGLCACMMVRIWVSLNERTPRAWAWAVDLTVTGISLLFTAGWIVLQRPEPFYALLSGTGFGALGAGIIAIALKWVKRIEPLAEEGPTALAAPVPESDTLAIQRLLGDARRALDEHQPPHT